MEQENRSSAYQICDHCLKQIEINKLQLHYSYCVRNFRRCAQCNQMYDHHLQEQHHDQFHGKELCRMCNQQFAVSKIKKHQQTCNFRPKQCQYCDLGVPVRQYDSHFKMCQSRTTKCEICNGDVVNKQYYLHISTCNGTPPISHKQNLYKRNHQDRFVNIIGGEEMNFYNPHSNPRKKGKKQTASNYTDNNVMDNSNKKSTATEIFSQTGKRQTKSKTIKTEPKKTENPIIDVDNQQSIEDLIMSMKKPIRKNKKVEAEERLKKCTRTHKIQPIKSQDVEQSKKSAVICESRSIQIIQSQGRETMQGRAAYKQIGDSSKQTKQTQNAQDDAQIEPTKNSDRQTSSIE